MGSNPLEVLGVPKVLVVREREQGRTAAILRLAEDFHKSLAKQYHPDREGGDAALMASFTEALEELRDPDGLEYYTDELLDAGVRQQATASRSNAAVRDRDKRAFAAVAGELGYVNQWEVLDTTVPVTIFTTDGRTRHIFNVVSPSVAEAYVAPLRDEQLPMDIDDLKYDRGAWSELYIIGDRAERKVHDNLVRLGDVRVIGSISMVAMNEYRPTNSVDPVSGTLDVGSVNAKLEFIEPEYAWYLADLVPECRKDDDLVVYANEKVALGSVIEGIEVM